MAASEVTTRQKIIRKSLIDGSLITENNQAVLRRSAKDLKGTAGTGQAFTTTFNTDLKWGA